MQDEASAPIFVFAPFVSSTMAIEPGWIDYNGHLNMAYYMVLFDRAVDEAFAVTGLGPDYMENRGCSFFVAEAHAVYLRELTLDDRVRVTVQLLDHDEKRLHAYLEIRHAGEGWVAATCEKLFLHVEMASRRVIPLPTDIQAKLGAMKAAHARLARPDTLGRVIGLGARRPERKQDDSATRH